MGRLHNLLGGKFHRLTILSRAGVRDGCATWNYICDCGKFGATIGKFILNGKIKSCGCLKIDKATERCAGMVRQNTIHGHAHMYKHTSTYRSWCAMKARCYNVKHQSYKRYGGRGISVCARWFDFRNFLKDVGERPKGKTLDRIDGNFHYMPSNCRWATPLEQTLNRAVCK